MSTLTCAKDNHDKKRSQRIHYNRRYRKAIHPRQGQALHEEAKKRAAKTRKRQNKEKLPVAGRFPLRKGA